MTQLRTGRFKGSKSTSSTILLGLVLALPMDQTESAQAKDNDATQPGKSIGAPALDFTLPSNGRYNLKLSEQQGKVVALLFWSSWCGSCALALEQFSQLERELDDDDLKIWALNIDEQKKYDHALDHYQRHQFSLPVLFDTDHSVSKGYDIGDLPVVMIIDRDGNLQYRSNGFDQRGFNEVSSLLQQMVSEP